MNLWLTRFRASLTSLTPKQVLLLCVVGLVLGVFPLPGFPTLLCLIAAFGLRLNIPALQLLNNVTSPLQWLLWLPLERIGATVCGGAVPPIAGKLGVAAWHAVLGWSCVCVPVGILLYLAFAGAGLCFNRKNSSQG
jgi:hypothetical protein